MLTLCLPLLEDSEPRVRAASGQLLGPLAKRLGAGPVWTVAGRAILASIDRNWVGTLLLVEPAYAPHQPSAPHIANYATETASAWQ